MSASENIRARGGHHGFDVYLQLAAADQAVIVSRIFAKAEVEIPRPFGGNDFAGDIPDLGFNAPPTDRPHHRSIFANQEFGAFVAGDRSLYLHDGGQGAFLSHLAQTDQLIVDIHGCNYTGETRFSLHNGRCPRRLWCQLLFAAVRTSDRHEYSDNVYRSNSEAYANPRSHTAVRVSIRGDRLCAFRADPLLLLGSV